MGKYLLLMSLVFVVFSAEAYRKNNRQQQQQEKAEEEALEIFAPSPDYLNFKEGSKLTLINSIKLEKTDGADEGFVAYMADWNLSTSSFDKSELINPQHCEFRVSISNKSAKNNDFMIPAATGFTVSNVVSTQVPAALDLAPDNVKKNGFDQLLLNCYPSEKNPDKKSLYIFVLKAVAKSLKKVFSQN